MAKDGTNRGGPRPGTGPKRKPLADKITDGTAKAKLLIELAQKLLKVAEDIRSLADSVQAVCTVVTDSLSGEAKEVPKLPEKEQPTISLEKVRGVLADKSRSGHTAEVRAIIKKYGADRLSELDPKDYAAVLKEAEVL